MYTVTYYKLGQRWYLDSPDYIEKGGKEEDLERIGAFRDFLELAAEGETTVIFQMDTQPFADTDHFELVASSGGETGGYYHLSHFRGQPADLEVWFNAVIFTSQPFLPEKIYFRKLSLPSHNL